MSQITFTGPAYDAVGANQRYVVLKLFGEM
jgi:hypothetical protein